LGVFGYFFGSEIYDNIWWYYDYDGFVIKNARM
jgi:hypothetical protein